MLGRTPGHIQAIRPLKDGVIADFDICEKMLRYFIQRVHQRKWAKPRMVICIPSGITGVEQRAVQEAAEYAGARKPVHRHRGADGRGDRRRACPVHEPAGNMIVDIGGGTTEVAVISLGGIVVERVEPRRRRRVRRSDHQLREDASTRSRSVSAPPKRSRCSSRARTRSRRSSTPRSADATSSPVCRRRSSSRPQEIREAIEEPVAAIVDAVKVTLDKTPPELAADIMERASSSPAAARCSSGSSTRSRPRPACRSHRAKHPLYSVVLGSGQCLEKFDVLQQVLSSSPQD